MGFRERTTPLLISLVTVLAYIDTHSLHPFLSVYAGALGAGILLTDIIIASFSLSEDLFEIISEYLMDKFKRRKSFLVFGV